MTWQSVILALGKNATLLAALVWLGKVVFEKLLDRDSKQFSINLEAKAKIELELYRSQLAQQAMEHQVRFSILHEKQADIIGETYKLLDELYCVVLTNRGIIQLGNKTEVERREEVNTALVALRRYLPSRQLYLPQKIADNIFKAINKLLDVIQEYELFTGGMANSEGWNKALVAMRSDIPPILDKLRIEFRRLLGHKPETGETQGANAPSAA